jgi:sialate O-acetylesterase
LTPEAGGPYFIKISSSNDNIIIKDILIGEIWLASGQSNMEMPLVGYPPYDYILNFEDEIKNANYPEIRMFNVEKQYSNEPLEQLNGRWLEANSEHIKNFSSTAYFFARDLHETLNIPIGIIHSSWGGSPCEGWTSEQKLNELGLFEDDLKTMNNNIPKVAIDKWFEKFNSIDIPKQKYPEDNLNEFYEHVEFLDKQLSNIDFVDKEWGEVILPGRFDTLISEDFDGAVWFRKEIHIDDVTSDYVLNIGYIDDMDKIYINGNYIGGLSGWGYWNQKRKYNIPKTILKHGKNSIAIRAIDTGGPGRIIGVMNLSNNYGKTISIDGLWKYYPIAEIYENKFYIYSHESIITDRPEFIKFNPMMPKVLFNSMIYPLIPYTIKGAIWYQGESNVGRHDQYSKLFPGMIEDWRSRWKYEFPFYFVQIAPFRYTKDTLKNVSQKLRESQRQALKVPKTGMVVTLDIGEFDNIHPGNKQDVGKRLARLALVNDYNSVLNPIGPLLKGGELIENSIKLNFSHVGSGLTYLNNKANQFKISGPNMIFFEATVTVQDSSVYVSSSLVKNPLHVRYAWSDTPTATLFNGDGFPASSFELEIK